MSDSNYSQVGSASSDVEWVLETFLKRERPYLDPAFSVTVLTIATGLPYHRIHAYLKSKGITFAELRMTLRIRHAVELIDQGTSQRLTLEAIARECGYVSRTNFLTHFKKVVGVTPTEYAKAVWAAEAPIDLKKRP